MKTIFNYFLALILTIISATLLMAQQPLPSIKGWRIHAAFGNNNDIAEAGDEIVVGSNNAMFVYNKITNELDVRSRVSGLSDVLVRKLLYDPSTSTLVVAYDNANIDLWQNGRASNVPDIVNRIIVGEKRINKMILHKGRVYMACSFGVVVVDLKLKRIVDTYQNIGPGGTNIDLLDISFFNDSIYVLTKTGIYRASEKIFNLSDFQSWSLFKSATNYRQIESFNNRLFAMNDSTLEVYDGNVWSVFGGITHHYLYDMRVSRGKLLVSLNDQLLTVNDDLTTISNTDIKGARASILAADGNYYAIIDEQGMLRFPNNGGNIDYITPSGPLGSFAMRMKYADKKMWFAGDVLNGLGLDGGWGPNFTGNKTYLLKNNTWKNFKGTDSRIDAAPDLIDVTIHPDNGYAFFASFGTGVIEMNEDGVVNLYDTTNSSLEPINFSSQNYKPINISGVDFDNNRNLWVSNFGAVNPISVKLANGQWKSFPLPSNVNTAIGFITCDDAGNKWIINTRGNGLIVFRENDLNSPNDDQVKVLNKDKLNGALPSTNVFCVTKDKKGELWVGTSKGLCIFSNPGRVFTPNADFDAKQIIIQSGSIFSYFLDETPIYSIAVDAANRKWIGTANGAWLVSADGYTVIKNFNSRNSPLPDNVVYEIGIDASTGEVFFSTNKGLISYVGDATEGEKIFSNVNVYPNPVEPGYDGDIVVNGLIQDCYVKFTDMNGNLVHETRSNGGTATWNGTNYSGSKVSTGVYLIFAADEEGIETFAGKVLIVR
jgi:hypothetical protein